VSQSASPSATAGTAAAHDPVRRILLARGLRDFGDGLVAVLLPAYLVALGFGAAEVGVVATLALLGSALMTLGVGVWGTRADPRLLLLLAAGLMAATGLGLAAATAFAAVAAVALVGTANPSAGSVSVFAPLEQAMLTGATEDARRTAVFARYSLVGALAAAAGALAAAGRTRSRRPACRNSPRSAPPSSSTPCSASPAFLAYRRSRRSPPPATRSGTRRSGRRAASSCGSRRCSAWTPSRAASRCSPSSRSGCSSASACRWPKRAVLLLVGRALGLLLPGRRLARGRVGLVNTMVWTHIPSSLCLIGAALAPTAGLALGLLLLRAALSQMDVPTRTSYVMAVVTPAERTAASSFTAVPRSLAAAASPALAGAVFAAGHHAAPLIACGALKIIYDLALLAAFRHIKPPEER
jgi:MFS family permease